MSYSGKAKFDYEIERMKHKVTGELFHLDSISDETEETYEYVCINLKVEGTSYYQEGKTFGPPESCFPDEGDTEITSIIGPDGKSWEDELSGKEKESIQDQVASESEVDYDGPDESDYDYDYDNDNDDDYDCE